MLCAEYMQSDADLANHVVLAAQYVDRLMLKCGFQKVS